MNVEKRQRRLVRRSPALWRQDNFGIGRYFVPERREIIDAVARPMAARHTGDDPKVAPFKARPHLRVAASERKA